MPKVSVFTPSHDPKYLDECYKSLKAQTFEDWEWIVLLNGGTTWDLLPHDPQVLVQNETPRPLGVGAAKKAACALAKGDILVELDHDDLMLPDALELIVNAFDRNPGIGFVYSDTTQINEDGSRNNDRFDLRHGWEYYEDLEEDVQSVASMEPFPHNVSYIWYAPNHVRAFRRELYEKVGGYDETRDVLDDQDLMCRMYAETDFYHIPAPLYKQRVHAGNTQKDATTNARIQVETVDLYDRYIQPNALAWAKRNGLRCLDLGGAHNSPEGYEPIDKALSGNDVIFELRAMTDNSVGVIRAVDFLEHVTEKVGLWNEMYRVLAHGGILLSLTPSTDGRGAFQDPTHVAYYNENSMWYFTDASFSRYVPEIQCRFQSSRLMTYYPSDWHRKWDISYVLFNGIAIKDGPRQGGFLNI